MPWDVLLTLARLACLHGQLSRCIVGKTGMPHLCCYVAVDGLQ